MKQTLKENDPKLTAFALGELSRDEAAEVAHQLRLNPALQKEVDQIDSLSLSLTSVLAPSHEVKLSAQQKATIFQSGKTPSEESITSMHKKQWRRPLILSLIHI